MESWKFLGFSFYRAKEGIRIRLAPKIIKRIKAKVKEITKRNHRDPWKRLSSD